MKIDMILSFAPFSRSRYLDAVSELTFATRVFVFAWFATRKIEKSCDITGKHHNFRNYDADIA